MNNDFEVRIVEAGFKPELDVYIYKKLPQGQIGVLHGGVVTSYKEAEFDVKPTFSLSPTGLQKLADELDKRGIKPQKGFMEGKLSATEKHLEDMRTLVFKEIKND